MSKMVLSCFPGIGLLDKSFEEAGYCVVRGPDVLWGGDIRRFHPPSGVFGGVIGGPPCQTFSGLAKLVAAKGYTPKFGNLIPEFERVIGEAGPEWFVMENVMAAPTPYVVGYRTWSAALNPLWLGDEQDRMRRISFGTRDGRALLFDYEALQPAATKMAVTGKGTVLSPATIERLERNGERVRRQSYALPEMLKLQGLPPDFLNDAPFTVAGKMRVVGNGVPLPMGRAIARAVRRAMQPDSEAAS